MRFNFTFHYIFTNPHITNANANGRLSIFFWEYTCQLLDLVVGAFAFFCLCIFISLLSHVNREKGSNVQHICECVGCVPRTYHKLWSFRLFSSCPFPFPPLAMCSWITDIKPHNKSNFFFVFCQVETFSTCMGMTLPLFLPPKGNLLWLKCLSWFLYFPLKFVWYSVRTQL